MARKDAKPATPPMLRETRLLLELIRNEENLFLWLLLKKRRYRTPEILDGEDAEGNWPMRVAARRGNIRALAILKAAGANLDRRSSSQRTNYALWEAEDYYQHEARFWFLKNGATPFERTYGTPSLHTPKAREFGPA